ncbi:MAG: hypothetical protein NTV86_16105 [Planctomycetota bacterium]|nr:hypothetical protein [Planctomycetota bacterium]
MGTGFHCVDVSSADKVDKALQSLLDSGTGVLGITVDSLAPVPGDRWTAGVIELVHWVLRLLPLDGATSIDVFLECRGQPTFSHHWEPVRSEILRQLAEVDPARASRIAMAIHPVSKGGHPVIGYADLVAYSWGSPTATSRERLKRSGLPGRCLMDTDSRTLRSAWDVLGLRGRLAPAPWRDVVTSGEFSEPGSVAAALLDQVRQACLHDGTLWQGYLAAAREHLESKAVDLDVLGRELSWLASCQPAGQVLPPKVRLAFLTSQLAAANHRGAVEPAWQADIRQLSDRLFDEDPAMVCYVDLHLAVAAMNRFDFAGAAATLGRWAEVPRYVPGLQMYARAQSSLGQVSAFLGDAAESQTRFRKAMEAFGELSDPALAAAERKQTGAYLAIAAMDDENCTTESARACLEAVTGPMDQALASLAPHADNKDKYAHHLLLRFLLKRGTPDDRKRYLATAAQWDCGEGHPWELIEAYRALLLRPTDSVSAAERLDNAWQLAFAQDQGPTVRLIGATLGVVGRWWGRTWDNLAAELDALERELPLAATQVSALRAACNQVGNPLGLLEAVLPFNFH